MTSATDELQRMLDERGVEWKERRRVISDLKVIQRETLWGQPTDAASGKPITHVYHYRATEMGDGRLFLEAQLVTPEQAIAAMLGAGTCRLKRAQWDDGTCTWGCICTACDAHLEHETGIGYNYCPHCGRKVIDE